VVKTVPKVADFYSVNETKRPVAERRLSSPIVRGVGCAALTFLLAATTCPTFGAPTARAVESLSAAERANLPDTTLIKLSNGQTVSLGILRSQHQLRLQRFAMAASLALRVSRPAPSGFCGILQSRGCHSLPVSS